MPAPENYWVLHDAADRATARLVRDVSKRLRDIVDEEASCHETICNMMSQLVMGDENDRPGLGDLIEALQYFDRLQQRTGALCVLIENLTDSFGSGADPADLASQFCSTAPVARDATWLNEHMQTFERVA